MPTDKQLGSGDALYLFIFGLIPVPSIISSYTGGSVTVSFFHNRRVIVVAARCRIGKDAHMLPGVVRLRKNLDRFFLRL